MTRHLLLAGVAAVALVGCKSLDGDYYPGCTAFAGDHLRLESDRFTWDRFTDQVRVDSEGRTVDPFPDYPRSGEVARAGDALQLTFADDGSVRTLHVIVDDSRIRLLTDAEKATFDADGTIDACALAREDR